jgi:hypothetical protein
MHLERLFPARLFTSPIADYEKIVRIFANFVAGRYDHSNADVDTLPADANLQASFSLSMGPFRLSINEDLMQRDVIIEGQRGIANRIRLWSNPNRPNYTPFPGCLVPAPETGVFFADQPYRLSYSSWSSAADFGTWGTSDYDTDVVLYNSLCMRLDFSLTQEEILFNLADKFSIYPDKDRCFDCDLDPWPHALNHQDKSAIYWELWFLNHEDAGDQVSDYGQKAFEMPMTNRRYIVLNIERAEAILHYSMRLIARRYAAPHGDPLAETLFNRLPATLRNSVYGELYTILGPPQSEHVWNYEELAFHGRLGTATNAGRRAAILNFVNKGQKVM